MGANVIGVDLSDVSIAKAKELNDTLGLNVEFICSDVYALPSVHNKQYDIVFSSYGVLGWLPDMKKWASVVSHFLKPGGKLVLVETHPMMWIFDSQFTRVEYPYFNKEAIVEVLEGTYADRNAPIKLEEIGWNHPFSDIIGSLLDAGLRLDMFREYDYFPYDAFANAVESAPGKYQIKGLEGKLPLLYSIVATK
jgi:ubiquinone/menaquinone biosynthesis C-methylase UbiE